MSVTYKAVLWNKQKRQYDRLLWLGIGGFMLIYIALQFVIHPTITIETLIIRAFGLSALLLLHAVLMIGPLCRLDSRFLPLLYNRRHAGVSMFILAIVHGIFSIIQFHTLGDTPALLSLFVSNQQYAAISAFPFQIFGFFALIILFLMAATSHDFWLKNLHPRIWKALHMGVYVAYALILLHVATGAFQYESHPLNWILLFLGFAMVAGLHIVAGTKEVRKLRSDHQSLEQQGFYPLCAVEDIENNAAKTFFIDGENIAVFKYDNKVSAVNNVCKHQMGPLGEGRVVDGCITCPWHGYQYMPENGQSPPPFQEKISTYTVRVENDQIWVNPNPHPEGTAVDPAIIS